MDAKTKACSLCQQIGMTSFGSDFNEGSTLPLDITKKIAVIMVDEILESLEKNSLIYPIYVKTETKYWESVKEEISKI